MDIFEKASREKLRVTTPRGALTVEQLWDLPLTSAKNLSLNGIGMAIQKELRELGEDSLVDTATTPAKTTTKLTLDIIKRIIEVKQSENKAAIEATERRARKEKLLEALERKQDASLENMSEEEIRKEIEAM